MSPLTLLWHRLGHVQTLEFLARSSGQTGWDGQGIGTVTVQADREDVWIYYESGTWQPTLGGADLRFRNTYRWTRLTDRVRLEHLRFGPENPVLLFDLVPENEGVWKSASGHLCQEDCYTASLLLADDHLLLCWAIVGPRKNESIEYRYRS